MAGIAGVGATGSVYAFAIEPYWLEFTRVKMNVNNLPTGLVGKTLMQISDIHIGRYVKKAYLVKSFGEAARLAPDFVVYTGDFTSYKTPQQIHELKELLPLFPKGKLGTVAVLGNHDYGKNWLQNEVADQTASELRASGITVLRNEQVKIAGLNFIGFDDYWATNFHPELVMPNYDSAGCSVVLCHNPDACDLDVWNGYRGWILSGHTHGGQVKPPFLDAPILPVKNKRYSSGKIALEDGRTLYINRALGNLHHIRFNVRPEITVFELA